MQITGIQVITIDLKLSEPYTIAYETVDRVENVFLLIETNRGITGLGVAAPDWEVTRETAKTVEEAVNNIFRENLIGQDPLRITWHIERLKKLLPHSPSALAMVDIALHDLLGKVTGQPVWKLLGGFRQCIATSITIGIHDPQETLIRAKDLISKGFRILKIKGGTVLEEDIEKMLKVREVLGDEIELRFDANQGYTVEQAIKFVKETEKARLELLEQPTCTSNPGWLGEVTSSVHLPVMADESLKNLLDVYNLARKEHADMINVKLMKVGGLLESIHINSVARAAGMDAMVGCMDESAMGIAAGLHFALSRPNVVYADLDGHFDLLSDPGEGAVVLKEGILYPANGPGFGLARFSGI